MSDVGPETIWRIGRAVGVVVGAILAAFVAGYALFGPVALRLLPR